MDSHAPAGQLHMEYIFNFGISSAIITRYAKIYSGQFVESIFIKQRRLSTMSRLADSGLHISAFSWRGICSNNKDKSC